MKRILILTLALTIASPALARDGYSAGAMLCAEINRPHDPRPVRQWLRGFFSGLGYSRDYQAAAAEIGEICQEHPEWSLYRAANYWNQNFNY